MADKNENDDLAEMQQTIDDIKAGVRRPDGRRAQRAVDEARWKFLPTTGITRQVPREDKVPCASCGGVGETTSSAHGIEVTIAGLKLEDVEQDYHAHIKCGACEGTGKVSHVRLVPFIVRSPLTVKRVNLARAFKHESCEAYAKYSEPRALRVDAYARGHRNVQMKAA